MLEGIILISSIIVVIGSLGWGVAASHARRKRKNEAAWESIAKRLAKASTEHPTGRPGIVARIDEIDVSAWYDGGEVIVQATAPNAPELEVVLTPPSDVDVFDGDPTALVAALRKVDLLRYRMTFSAHTLTLRWSTLAIDEEDVFRRVREVAAVCASLERGYRG